MFSIDMRLDGGFTPEALLSLFGLQDHGPVQQAIDLAVIRYMVPYWAYETGTLANSAYTDSDIGSGEIVYDTPYASVMYYGVSKKGDPINYHLDHNPQAGAYPFERMVADHYEDILEEARNVAGNSE